MKTIEPASTKLFCERQKPEESNQSGIIIPPSAQDETQLATVLAIGDGVAPYGAGDTIIYKEYTTTDITMNDRSYFLVDIEDVLGRVTEA